LPAPEIPQHYLLIFGKGWWTRFLRRDITLATVTSALCGPSHAPHGKHGKMPNPSQAMCGRPLSGLFVFTLGLAFFAPALSAQACLTLSPARIAPGNILQFDLSLSASPGDSPAALQWTFQYPPASIQTFTVDDGPALDVARKTVFCSATAGAYRCLIAGANRNPIPDGIVARVNATLAAGVATADLSVTNLRGASATGYFLPVHYQNASAAAAGSSPRERIAASGQTSGRPACSLATQEKDK